MADEQLGDQTVESPVQEPYSEPIPTVVNEPLDAFPVECPEGEHALQSPWSWWFDKKLKAPSGTVISDEDYKANMRRIGTVHSIEQFASYYRNCKKPADLPTDCNLHLMRYNTLPMWESFPLGGCWLVKISSKGAKHEANWMWERLLFSAIGEAFESPDMIGVGLSIRPKGIVLSVWNLNEESQSTRFAIGEKLKEIVQLPQYATIEYKCHNMSMQDRSSFRNARPYLIVAAEKQQSTQAPAMQLPPAAVQNSTGAAPAPAEAAAPEAPAAEEEQSPVPETAPEPAPASAETSEEPKEPAKLSFAEMAKRKSAK